MHAQTGAGVDLDDDAGLFFQRPADVRERPRPRRRYRRPTARAASTARAATSGWTRSVTSVAVPPVLRLPLRRISTRCPAAGTDSGVKPCSADHVQGHRVELDDTEGRGVAITAARVAVDFGDELLDGRAAVADDLGRLAQGGSHQAVADDQAGGSPQPGRVAFDDNIGASLRALA